jgi:alpha-ketoglutarate-dependent taurine dioxygenase
MINDLYNNNYEFVQTEDYIVLRTEMISHARIIPINSEHKMAALAPMFGESVAHWDGDTLVVETTNFSLMQEEAAISLTTSGQVVERFIRVSEEQIIYGFTVDDPEYYSQSWHGELSFLSTPSQVYEFACHEGNYVMSGILAGARRAEHDQQQTAQ